VKLSIVIPTCNRNDVVSECISALEPAGSEIVVVDDGSAIPVQPPPYVRLIRHDRNRGRAAACNTGLKAASNDLVLIIDDDIFAAPDMVARLVDEFIAINSPQLALVGRVVWDPEVPVTLTMRWLEDFGPFHDISEKYSGPLNNLSTGNTLLWRPFVLEHGGFDEGFTHYGLEDVELGLRLKEHGLKVRLVAQAVGYHHKVMRISDLVRRELAEGQSAVYLYSKFPEHLPQVGDVDLMLRNEGKAREAEAAVAEIELLEETEASNSLPAGAVDLFATVYRHYFLMGVLKGLKETGTIKQQHRKTHTLAIYNQASHLESLGEFDEARRLFQLVLSRKDEEYWAGAEYHMGRILTQLGDTEAGRIRLLECLRMNPDHRKARESLKMPDLFKEVRPNVFERVGDIRKPKIMFVLFGALGDVINGFPVVAAMREKFPSSEIAWLTLPEYAPLARASFADVVYERTPRGIVPWDWIHSEGFTHVFYPEGNANHNEWEESGLHMIDFMAQKCGVELESHRAWLEPGPEALFEAEAFLHHHGLTRKRFLTASHVGISSRYWPHSHLARTIAHLDIPTVVFGAKDDPAVEGTIPCFGKSFRMVAALIRWSAFYLGPDSGVSWIATTTNTPMGVFMDPVRRKRFNVGFQHVLRNDKEDIQEWDISTHPDVVIDHIKSSISDFEFRISNSHSFMEEQI
jgi:ADP-heptose:LPS heptosyltransferase